VGGTGRDGTGGGGVVGVCLMSCRCKRPPLVGCVAITYTLHTKLACNASSSLCIRLAFLALRDFAAHSSRMLSCAALLPAGQNPAATLQGEHGAGAAADTAAVAQHSRQHCRPLQRHPPGNCGTPVGDLPGLLWPGCSASLP
jgi:hypothetical protein